MKSPSQLPSLSSTPSLRELAALSKNTGRFEWSPDNSDQSQPKVRLFYILLFLSIFAVAGLEVTGSPSRTKTAHSDEGQQGITAYSLKAILSQGTQFYVVKKSITPEDLHEIALARSRNANITVVCEITTQSNVGFKVASGLITHEGVLVNGGRWLPLSQ